MEHRFECEVLGATLTLIYSDQFFECCKFRCAFRTQAGLKIIEHDTESIYA